MTAATPAPATGHATVRGVEIFSTGVYQGKEYTHADLDDMRDNFSRHKDRVKPPLVVGHEEDQVRNTGVPAVGRPNRLWREDVSCRTCQGTGKPPDKMQEGMARAGKCPGCLGTGKQGLLKADLVEVPRSIARLINGRAYDKVSSEVYQRPPEGIPGGTGKMLRRVAILGGELPHIKTLKDLPHADYDGFAETFERQGPDVVLTLAGVRELPDGAFECFSEVTKLTEHKPAGPGGGQFTTGRSITTEEAESETDDIDKKHADKKSEQAKEKTKAAATGKGHRDAAKAHEAAARAHKEAGMGTNSKERAAYHGQREKEHDAAAEHHAGLADKVAKHAEDRPMTPTKPDDGDMDDDGWKKMDPREGCKKFGEYCAKKMSEYQERGKRLFGSAFGLYTQGLTKMSEASIQTAVEAAVAKALADRAGAVAFSEADARKQLQPIIDAAVQTAVAEVKAQMGPIQRDVDTFKESTRKDSLAKFVETQRQAGKISAAECDETAKTKNPRHRTVLDRLLACDARNVVHKFTENGKDVELTQLDIEKAAIEARTPFHFGERVKQGGLAGQADTETAKVEAHYDLFAEKFEKLGEEKEDFVKAFKLLRKQQPGVTAEQFLNQTA